MHRFWPILAPKIDQKSDSKIEGKGATDGYPYLHGREEFMVPKMAQGGGLKVNKTYWALLFNFGCVFWTLDHQKWVFGVCEVLFFRNSRFSCRIRFRVDFLMISGMFGTHFGSQNGSKMRSKINQKNCGILDRSLQGSGRQKGATTESYPPVLGPRGRVGKG